MIDTRPASACTGSLVAVRTSAGPAAMMCIRTRPQSPMLAPPSHHGHGIPAGVERSPWRRNALSELYGTHCALAATKQALESKQEQRQEGSGNRERMAASVLRARDALGPVAGGRKSVQSIGRDRTEIRRRRREKLTDPASLIRTACYIIYMYSCSCSLQKHQVLLVAPFLAF